MWTIGDLTFQKWSRRRNSGGDDVVPGEHLTDGSTPQLHHSLRGALRDAHRSHSLQLEIVLLWHSSSRLACQLHQRPLRRNDDVRAHEILQRFAPTTAHWEHPRQHQN